MRDRDRTRVIDVDTIDRIEAADYYAVIHVSGDSHLLRETMNELEQRLDPGQFFRVHRSTIIRLDRVREIIPLLPGDRELVLADGARVRLSRTRRAEFEAVYATGDKLVEARVMAFVVHATTRATGCRLGLSVGRRVGNAPTRNRVKRVLREAFRQIETPPDPPLDLVLVARPGRAPQTLADARDALDQILRRWQPPSGRR